MNGTLLFCFGIELQSANVIVNAEALAEFDGEEERMLDLITNVGCAEVVDEALSVVIDLLLAALASSPGLLLGELLLDLQEFEWFNVGGEFAKLYFINTLPWTTPPAVPTSSSQQKLGSLFC